MGRPHGSACGSAGDAKSWFLELASRCAPLPLSWRDLPKSRGPVAVCSRAKNQLASFRSRPGRDQLCPGWPLLPIRAGRRPYEALRTTRGSLTPARGVDQAESHRGKLQRLLPEGACRGSRQEDPVSFLRPCKVWQARGIPLTSQFVRRTYT